MNREEAINRFKEIRQSFSISIAQSKFYPSKAILDELCDMAIKALQNEPTPCEKCIHVKSCRKVIILKNRTYKLVKYCSQGAERKEP